NGYTTAIYGLFAGGDDFVFIGPWDMIIDFAQDINNEFKEYTSQNPWFTLSAGINLSLKNYPISRALLNTEKLLEESKTFLKNKTGLINLKNSVTIFGETVLWKRNTDVYFTHDDKRLGDLEFLIESAKKIVNDDLNKNKIPSRFIHLLLELWLETFQGLTREEIQKVRTTKVDYYPIIAYQVARMFKDDTNEKNKQFQFYNQIIPWIKIPATWAIYRNRKEQR
ncbi:MAG: Cas10/Cmr2 second palm domain-containing protein, partial [Candidatus Heimdallarchaeaceae archaeon]